MDKKEMKQAIKDRYDAIPEAQISAGLYIHHIGTKYVYILDTWETTTIRKVEILDFYDEHF